MPVKQSTKVQRICEACAIEFKITRGEFNRGRGRFCSRKCSASRQRPIPNVQCICEACGQQFETHPHRIRAGRGRVCSKRCAATLPRAPVTARFNRLIAPPNENGCILWLGARSERGPYGYGSFCPGGRGKTDKAHRVAWQIANGPIPADLCVLHKCDVPLCVNVEHLFLGTQADNAADRSRKRRSGQTKLTSEQANTIRTRYAAGGVSQLALGREYGVSQAIVSMIVRRVKVHKYV